MEKNIQCPVIKNMKAEFNSSYNDSSYLKKKVGCYPTENNFISSMITPSPPIILSHHHHYHQHHQPTFPSYPPRIFKDVDYTRRMFPPLGFDNNISNPNSLTIQPPPSSPKHQLPVPNLKHLEKYEEPVTKRPKFDFSIKALTAKEDSRKIHCRQLGLHNENVFPSPPTSSNIYVGTSPFVIHEDKENKDVMAYPPVNVKSRGRPSADLIEILKQRSMQSPHRYSCPVCHRSFPRKKSLDTHRLTHSDVKPYPCDFPGCNRRFKQSGQLKTHLRLHTGEKPFRCTHPNCDSVFTHANRKCVQHPDYPLRRSSTDALSEDVLKNISNDKCNNSENLQKIKQWFEKHFSNKEFQTIENKENISPEKKFTSIKSEPTDEENGSSFHTHHHSDENNKRLLSAVALVELQMKNPLNRKGNYSQLFTSNSDF